jgi:alcohol dehydrogenase
VDRGADAARRFKADLIIGLGGGSALDSAKAIAALATQGGSVWDFVEGQAVKAALPILVVPSTAGTGSETTRYAIVTNPEKKVKAGFASEHILPRVAILDPEVMATVPPELTAYAGGDAFAQAVEAFLTRLAHPYSDILALESIRLCASNLRRAVQDGQDLEARAAMGFASSLAGIAISWVDVVIGHHVSEAAAAFAEIHHGCAAALLLPYTMEFNFEGTTARLASIARAMDEPVDGLSEEQAARRAIEAVRRLLRDIGIPEKLSALGVPESAVPGILEILRSRASDLTAGNTGAITDQSLIEFMNRVM